MGQTLAGAASYHLISVLHKVDALVDIPKQDEGFDNVQAGDEYGCIEEGGPHEVTARPLMGFQAVTNG